MKAEASSGLLTAICLAPRNELAYHWIWTPACLLNLNYKIQEPIRKAPKVSSVFREVPDLPHPFLPL